MQGGVGLGLDQRLVPTVQRLEVLRVRGEALGGKGRWRGRDYTMLDGKLVRKHVEGAATGLTRASVPKTAV